MVDKNERNIADLAKNSEASLKQLKVLATDLRTIARATDRMISALEQMSITMVSAMEQLNSMNEEPDSNKENN